MAISKRTGKRIKAGRLGDIKMVKNRLSMREVSDWTALAKEDHWYHLRVQFESGREADLLLTSREVARGLKRAKDHPEDVPPVNPIRDLLD